MQGAGVERGGEGFYALFLVNCGYILIACACLKIIYNQLPYKFIMESAEQNKDLKINVPMASGLRTAPMRIDEKPESQRVLKKMLSLGMEGEIVLIDGTCNAITRCGSKDLNEDGVLIGPDIIAVADGTAGKEDCSMASHEALKSILYNYVNFPYPLRDLFKRSCNFFEKMLMARESGASLAVARKHTTARGMNVFEVASAGDTKILVISLSKKKPLYESKEQTAVQDMLMRNVLKDPICRYNEPSLFTLNNFICCEGMREDPAQPITVLDNKLVPNVINALMGDTVIVAYTNGVSDFVTPEEICEIVYKQRHLCARSIVDLALSRHNRESGFDIRLGGRARHVNVRRGDNVSVAVMAG